MSAKGRVTQLAYTLMCHSTALPCYVFFVRYMYMTVEWRGARNRHGYICISFYSTLPRAERVFWGRRIWAPHMAKLEVELARHKPQVFYRADASSRREEQPAMSARCNERHDEELIAMRAKSVCEERVRGACARSVCGEHVRGACARLALRAARAKNCETWERARAALYCVNLRHSASSFDSAICSATVSKPDRRPARAITVD